ncbi:MAG: periplasmic heavy metal sensor, partial [Deltaproteobacteria bacterium]|nr:periplasmic heavy metal sensor [Deltaproteobacteria bacterium]
AAIWVGVALAGCVPALSREDVDEIKAIRLDFEEEIRPLEDQLARARAELKALLSDPETDYGSLLAAQEEIDKLQDELDQKWEWFGEEILRRFPALDEENVCRTLGPEGDDDQKGD